MTWASAGLARAALGTKRVSMDAGLLTPMTLGKRQKAYGGMSDFVDRPMSLSEIGKF